VPKKYSSNLKKIDLGLLNRLQGEKCTEMYVGNAESQQKVKKCWSSRVQTLFIYRHAHAKHSSIFKTNENKKKGSGNPGRMYFRN